MSINYIVEFWLKNGNLVLHSTIPCSTEKIHKLSLIIIDEDGGHISFRLADLQNERIDSAADQFVIIDNCHIICGLHIKIMIMIVDVKYMEFIRLMV